VNDAGREQGTVYRLNRLLAGGTDCPSLLRAILHEALTLEAVAVKSSS
jgi:hypothetical protein